MADQAPGCSHAGPVGAEGLSWDAMARLPGPVVQQLQPSRRSQQLRSSAQASFRAATAAGNVLTGSAVAVMDADGKICFLSHPSPAEQRRVSHSFIHQINPRLDQHLLHALRQQDSCLVQPQLPCCSAQSCSSCDLVGCTHFVDLAWLPKLLIMTCSLPVRGVALCRAVPQCWH